MKEFVKISLDRYNAFINLVGLVDKLHKEVQDEIECQIECISVKDIPSYLDFDDSELDCESICRIFGWDDFKNGKKIADALVVEKRGRRNGE